MNSINQKLAEKKILYALEKGVNYFDTAVPYAVHPGVIQTELSRHMDQADFDMIINRTGGNLKTKTVAAGAATSVYAATAPELEGRGGLYLYDCQIAEVDDDTSILDCVRSYAVDPAATAKLWSVSEKMVGQRFDL